MAITAPTGEQLRFVSSKTGEHVLDTYLEAAEIGNRQLHDLLDDMFDASTGVFRSDNFQFRYDTSTDKIQVRVGQFANSNTSWTDVTTFFKITGTFSASTTYNNFDLLTLSNKDVYIVHGLTSGTSFADEAAVIASSNTSKIVDVSEAKDWAMKTDGQVASTDYSSKAWAIGGTGVTNTASRGAAKEWATKTGSTVDGSDYSAKHWATTGNVATVSSGISNINTVAGSISNVNTVATDISNVNTLAGISANVTTVAGISANVTTVATNNTNINTVAGNNTNITSLATNMADIQTVADEIDNNKLQTVANNINAVITAADDLNETTSEIDTVANNIANVNTVGGISANVTTVAGISANVTTVAGISANTTTVAGIASNVTTVAGIAADVTTAAANTTAFNNLYLGAQSSAPTQDPDGSALDVGDLYFDTTSNTMKVRAASGWVNASSTVNGTANRFTFTATANQTTFTGADANGNTLAYDSGFMDVYMNGVKLAAADFTATNGTSVVISAAAAGDTLEMIAYGTFTLANIDINDLTNVNTTGVANHSILAYNSSNSRFEPTATPTFTSITVSGNVDGRDVSADGTKLDTIETNADVTDTANVTAAGALMDSELTNIAAVKALNQGLATTDEPSFDNTTLNAIAATISDTAVDVFVYDTRKDSDGGAWRKRTQHTSWYNEAASSTRGSRKEFPAVAVIVAENGNPQMTIYDGDDPDLPMWMVFNAVSGNYGHITYNTRDISCISALNGVICVGSSYSTVGHINRIKLLEDVTYNLTTTEFKLNTNIANRNVAADAILYSTNTLVNRNVNDVAMTALPNAPIDAATGLPVPTIAVATDGGISVIKDDGSVVSTASSSYAVGSIQILPTGEIYHSQGQSGNNGFCYNDNFERLSGLQIGTFANNSTFWYVADNVGNDSSLLGGGLADENAVNENLDTAVGTASGLTAIALNPSSLNDGMVAWRTSDYNAGWMVGDIKLATLSDTDDTNVTGAELVTNGTFDSDISGWTDPDSIASHDTNRISLTSASSNQRVYQAISTVVGQHYAFDFGTVTGNAAYYISNNTNSAQQLANSKTGSFTATQTTTYVVLYVIGTGNTSTFDNISVRLAEKDRSVNGNGLQVFGTVTKSAVATGADLVAYSGFSGSNWLEQPYNSDLDFGTGDFCYMTWFKMDNTSASSELFGRSDGTTYSIRVLVRPANPDIKFQIASTSNLATSYTYPHSTWNHICAVRKNGVAYIYVNAERLTLNTDANGGNVDAAGADAYSRIGVNPNDAQNPTQGDLALTRISATAPSPEQIAKIYEDEKHLFQENAQATLYGSSDAVTALAYDDSTELLHVGTSAGRSVFQGLRRVDNTTDAVGAAISASNGLVAED